MGDRMTPQTLAADEHKVGFTVTVTQGTFRNLIRLSAAEDMDSWSDVIARLIDKASK